MTHSIRTKQAMIFLRHHLHEGLKEENLTVKDPLVLWNSLKERYDHQKTVILPKAHYDYMHLRLQDYKTQQYCENGFKKYSKLISYLLVAEQNNELLMKNHEARPTGSASFPEVNLTTYQHHNQTQGRGRGCGHGRGRGRGRSGHFDNYGGYFKNPSRHLKWERNEKKIGKDKGDSNKD
ncbi:uncharacterized protein LOC109847372 [Asparagus officinalis]|uniref:uncharacterized protein LOC109847372 n=1 Tax=Asparagus officinalis TaxID=4686 RepID=UPI00098E6BCC|nr:uncharacterized protein LOC109847372 [Asparagus officinalis]